MSWDYSRFDYGEVDRDVGDAAVVPDVDQVLFALNDFMELFQSNDSNKMIPME